MVKFTTVSVSPETRDQIRYLAKVTKIPQNRLLGLIIDEIYSIGANFDRLSLDFESLVSQNKIYIYLSGKSRLDFRTNQEVVKRQ